MRDIRYIVIHCTATSPYATVDSIQRYWINNLGWKHPGYHYIVERTGNVVKLAQESQITNGVKGYNSNSIHISYIGGVDEVGNPEDTRTAAQKTALRSHVARLKHLYPNAEVLGHRDFPGVAKACPSFDVKTEL